jgi:hypothetical protein
MVLMIIEWWQFEMSGREDRSWKVIGGFAVIVAASFPSC